MVKYLMIPFSIGMVVAAALSMWLGSVGVLILSSLLAILTIVLVARSRRSAKAKKPVH